MYEVIVSEALLFQHIHDDDKVAGEQESHCAKAFFKIDEGDSLNGKLTEAFQVSVCNRDPEEPQVDSKSMFELMTTPPSMDTSDPNLIPIDFLEYGYSPFDKSLLYWDRHNQGDVVSNGHVFRGRSNRDLVMTEQFGSVSILKGIETLSTGLNGKSRYSDSSFDGICVDLSLIHI